MIEEKIYLLSIQFMLYDDITMNKVLTVQKFLDKSITREEAMKHLDCGRSTIFRYAKAYREKWPAWLRHGLKWKPSNNQNKKRLWLEKYARQERFRGFWPKLLSEKLEDILWYEIPVESLRRRMVEWWVWVPRKPLKPKRRPRRRKDWYWMMVQFDWSYHDWLENWEKMCLLLWVDDATGKAMHAKFTKNEAIDDVISYREEYFEIHGKPSVIYLDRHASYKVNHRKDQFDHTTVTRFQTAMSYFEIHVIFARSAQWKWRVENKFKLFQDRWVKECRLAWIKTYAEAQKYFQEVLIPQWNEKYWKEPTQHWDFHVPITEYEVEQLEWFFAKRSDRKMNKVWVVSYEGNKYVINKWQSLNWTREVKVLESHYWNIQIWNWKTQLSFEKWSKYFKN